MARVLVTGGTGFIGTHLVQRLVADGHSVAVLTRAADDPERAARMPVGARLVAGDVRDPVSIRRAIDAVAPEHVYHVAGAVMQGGKAAGTRDIAEVNLLGAVHLLDEVARASVDACVLIGDAFEYGPASGAVSERFPCAPTTLDGVAKLGATRYAQQLARDAALPVIIVRCFSVYGVGDAPRRLVPQVVERALDAQPVLVSQPHIVRDYVFVDDVVELLLAASDAAVRLRGEVVNCGSGVAMTLRDVVDTVLRVTGSGSDVQWGAFALAEHDERHPIADPALAREALGWAARTSFDDGVDCVVRDALRRRDRGPGSAAPGG